MGPGVVTERHDRPSLVSKVACEIAAEIIEGLRQPGDDLNSVELSRRYQRSCTPIREALMVAPSSLGRLRSALTEMGPTCRARDLNGYVWANVDFYDRNTQLANNRAVKRILDSLLLRTLRLRRLILLQPGRMQKSLDDHVRLVKA